MQVRNRGAALEVQVIIGLYRITPQNFLATRWRRRPTWHWFQLEGGVWPMMSNPKEPMVERRVLLVKKTIGDTIYQLLCSWQGQRNRVFSSSNSKETEPWHDSKEKAF